MRTRLTIENLVLGSDIEKTSAADFHSNMCTANKRDPSFLANLGLFSQDSKYTNTWFLKKNITYSDAVGELVAQEMFRLLISGQPKTRLIEPTEDQLAEDHEVNPEIYHLMSKQVTKFRKLSTYSKDWLADKINSGTYYGLGEILVASLLVNEVDLRFENLGSDENRQIIKIDGDRCLQHVLDGCEQLEDSVTEADIKALPKVVNYRAHNWLDQIEYYEDDDSATEKKQPEFCNALATSELVREEINRCLLKVVLMSDHILRNFIACYIDRVDVAKLVYDGLRQRKSMLRVAACQNESFCNYVSSPQSESDYREYLEYVRTFKTTGKHVLKVVDDSKYILRALTGLKNKIHYHELYSRVGKARSACPPNKTSESNQIKHHPTAR